LGGVIKFFRISEREGGKAIAIQKREKERKSIGDRVKKGRTSSAFSRARRINEKNGRAASLTEGRGSQKPRKEYAD